VRPDFVACRRRVGLRAVMSLAFAAVTAGCALAATAEARSAASPPAPGAWKLHSANSGAPEVKNGSFTVTSHAYVAGFHLTLGPGAESPCGTGALAVKVAGEQKLIDDPTNDIGGATDEYALSSPSDVITPVAVKVTVNGKQQTGALELAFGPGTYGGARTGGALYYNGNNCDLEFGFAKT
jgi:hypothetical protein